MSQSHKRSNKLSEYFGRPKDCIATGFLHNVKAKFKNTIIIDFETVPNGPTYHIGAVLKNKFFQRKDIKHIETALSELAEF